MYIKLYKTEIYLMFKKFSSVFLLITVIFTLTLSLSSCKKSTYYVKLQIKTYGDIILELDRDTAPITVDNFISLVNSGFYDGLTFHRVIEGFMIQGGAPASTSDSAEEIKGEFSANGHKNNIKHVRGVISMARTGDDKSGFDTASSQFFIMHDDAPHLDGQYAAFGHVVEGIEVVDAIVENTGIYAYNGIIYYKELQAVIEKATVLEDYQK